MSAMQAVTDLIPALLLFVVPVVAVWVFKDGVKLRERMAPCGYGTIPQSLKRMVVLNISMHLAVVAIVMLLGFNILVLAYSQQGWHPLQALLKLLELICQGCGMVRG